LAQLLEQGGDFESWSRFVMEAMGKISTGS